jgi:hypothetical protein
MAEPITSVLLVDYENLQRSFAAAGGDGQIADRAAAWLSALQDGRLAGATRRIDVKRCYAGAGVNGKVRDRLVAAGFDVVETGDGTRGSSDLHMAMDTIEALSRPNGGSEFLLFSPGSDLSPLLARLKAAKRTAAIIADAHTAPGEKAMADVLVPIADLVKLPAASSAAPEARPASAANERAEIEAFARKIHSATSLPLLSPKSYAELFRTLTEEVAANGYHFQTTAKNVADRMTAAGRNVTRRQVVFIVKGLALKGHVFSTNDTAERLAEVFREQARYLISNAGITLDATEEPLLAAWFQSRPAASPPRSQPAPSIVPDVPTTVPPSAETRARIAETIEREVAKAIVRPAERPKAPAPTRPTAPVRPPPVKPAELPKSTAKPAATRPAPAPTAREEAKAVIAARIAASAKIKKTTRTIAPSAGTNGAAPPTAAAPPEHAAEADHDEGRAPESLETSILAAIAEAVDVLVDEPEATERTKPAASRQPVAESPEEEDAAPTEVDEGESNDIGDQIQRIIASYNRNRSEE